jgi:hypothetical protein
MRTNPACVENFSASLYCYTEVEELALDDGFPSLLRLALCIPKALVNSQK